MIDYAVVNWKYLWKCVQNLIFLIGLYDKRNIYLIFAEILEIIEVQVHGYKFPCCYTIILFAKMF